MNTLTGLAILGVVLAAVAAIGWCCLKVASMAEPEEFDPMQWASETDESE